MREFEPQVGQRVEVPNPDGETFFDQMARGTITSVDRHGFTVMLDTGEESPYHWVVEDGVELIEDGLTLRRVVSYLTAVLEDGCTATDLGPMTDNPDIPIVLTHEGNTCPIHEGGEGE